LAVATLIAFLSTAARAADSCTATALVNIPAGGMGYHAKKGEKIDAVTELVKSEGRTYYCSHGGGCLAAYVRVGEKNVKAIRLDNCYVDLAHPHADTDEIVYYVEIDRRRNSAATLRYDDIDNEFLAMGLAPPFAATAALAYIRRPTSACGRLARMALEGSPDARRRINSNKNACVAEASK